MKQKFSAILAAALLTFSLLSAQELSIARIKYGGGGDWYADPSSLPNLMQFISANTALKLKSMPDIVEPGQPDFFNRHYYYITGHGNIRFSDSEILRLRYALENGAFLHADDNYGMDESFRREMKRVFPDKEWVELPFDHTIYQALFTFPNGLPKIHEHDGKPSQGLALFHEERMVVFYTYECDLGDGWEDLKVHNNPEELRQKALQMGTNIYWYHLNQ
jgi:hypothetical protein